MKISKYTMKSNELLETSQTYLTVGIQLSEKDIQTLLKHQECICQKLEWIELDSERFVYLVSLFPSTKQIHSGNYMMILTTAITLYYTVRKMFDYHTSDNSLCLIVSEVLGNNPIATIDEIITILKKTIIEEGGRYRDEKDILIYG